MCGETQTIFYHRCTHTCTITTPSPNPTCPRHTFAISYRLRETCPQCKFWPWKLTGHGFPSPPGRPPCKGFTGPVTRSIQADEQQSAPPPSSLEEKWARRKAWLGKYNEHLLRESEEEDQRTQARERAHGTSPLHRTYYLRLASRVPNRAFFRPVDKQDAATHYALSTELFDALSAPQKQYWRVGGKAMLPCGDVFDEADINTWTCGSGVDECPICKHRFRIVRVRRWIPEGLVKEVLDDYLLDRWREQREVAGLVLEVALLIGIAMLMFVMPVWNLWSLIGGFIVSWGVVVLLSWRFEVWTARRDGLVQRWQSDMNVLEV